MNDSLNVLSLFSGIGGIDLGLERAGMEIIACSEIDPYASRVLAKHWPDVPNIGDITTATFERNYNGTTYIEDGEEDEGYWLPPIDVIAGGFPCQDISLAGKGAGIEEGTRSGLWSEYARSVSDLQPRYVIVENVAALLNRGLDRVTRDLAEIGYDTWWDCIPAAAVGAPHLRDRVFVVATRADLAPFEARQSPSQWARTYGDRERRQGLETIDSEDRAVEIERRGDADRLRDAVADADHAGRVERRRAGTVPTQQLAAERLGEASHGTGPADDAVRGRHGREEGTVRPGREAAESAGWWLVEPSVGRVTHGIPRRVDRLRCLGNAVVPQVAQYIGEQVMLHHHTQTKGTT